MKIGSGINQQAALTELGQRLARLRLARNLTQGELARQAGIGLRTLQRLEKGAAASQLSSFLKVCGVLGLMEPLDKLIPETSISPLELLKREGAQPRRASRSRTKQDVSKPWEWGK